MPFFILSDTKKAVKRQLESEGIVIRFWRFVNIKCLIYSFCENNPLITA